jgi:hypothetical protein
VFTLVKTSPALLYSRLSSRTPIFRLIIFIDNFAAASSGGCSYGFITLAYTTAKYTWLGLQRTSYHYSCSLALSPSLSSALVLGSAVGWHCSHHRPQHQGWGGHLCNRVLISGIVIAHHLQQTVYHFSLLLDLGVAQGAAYSFALAVTYASQRVSWHDGNSNEVNCRNIQPKRLSLPTVLVPGHS